MQGTLDASAVVIAKIADARDDKFDVGFLYFALVYTHVTVHIAHITRSPQIEHYFEQIIKTIISPQDRSDFGRQHLDQRVNIVSYF